MLTNHQNEFPANISSYMVRAGQEGNKSSYESSVLII